MDIVYQGGLDDLDEPETLPLRIVELINRMDATEDPDERERLRRRESHSCCEGGGAMKILNIRGR